VVKMPEVIDLAFELEKAIEMSVEVIKKDGVILIPTETVYGLSCCVKSETAIDRISRIKARELGKNYVVLISGFHQLDSMGLKMNENAKILADRFWPGPLTLILPDSKGSAIAVRYSSVAFIQRLIAQSCPLISTSANLPGEKSPALFSEIDKNILDKVDLAVKGGALPGIPSTIVDMQNESPNLVRQGALEFDNVISVLKKYS